MNDKWIVGTLIFIFGVYTFGTFAFKQELGTFVQISIIAIIVIVASLALNTTLFYRGMTRFSKSYFFLFISLFCYGIAEILWGVFDYVGIETYPSLGDVFYSGYFIAGILFCFTVFWCNRKIIPKHIMIIGILVGIICMTSYIALSIDNFDSDNFELGTVMMFQSSILCGAGVITAIYILKLKRLKKIWAAFGIALLCNSIADVFYYSSENAGNFSYSDPVNLVWFGTLLLIFYGLYKHRFLYIRNA